MVSRNVLAFEVLTFAICVKGLVETCSLQLADHLIKGGQFQFLTNLTLALTTGFFALQLVNDLMMAAGSAMLSSSRMTSLLRYYHRLCHNCEFTVTVAYWSLYFMFPQLLNIDTFDVNILLDLEIHLFPYLVLTINSSLMPSKYNPTPNSHDYGIILAYLCGYWCYIEAIYKGEDVFPYPFLSQEPFAVRLLWLLGFSAMSCIHNYFYTKVIKT